MQYIESLEHKIIVERLRKRPRTPKDILKCTRRVVDANDVKSEIFNMLAKEEIMWQDGKFRLRGVVTEEDAKEAKEWFASRPYEDMRERND